MTPKEPEAADSPHPPPPTRSAKHRAPRPPAPPPPVPVTTAPAAISITPGPALVSVPSSLAGWERAQSTLPSVSNTLDDVFSSSLTAKSATLALPSGGEKEREKQEGEGSHTLATSPAFAQVQA